MNNIKKIINLPTRLQKVYDTLVDNNINVSDVYQENSDGEGLSWWFEFGNGLYLDDMTGTIHEETATQVIGRIKTESIYKSTPETQGFMDADVIFIMDEDGEDKDFNPYTNGTIKKPNLNT
tara:strand:+ start:47 stop:409 length:363 start_codon:yes stop_codon:yes gene_type:complete